MTYVYGAGLKKAQQYYIDSLPEHLKTPFSKILFKKFYEFLKELFEGTIFFSTPISELLEEIKKIYSKKKKLTLITGDKCKIPLEYYCLIKIRTDRGGKNKNNRDTIVLHELSTKIDKIKMFIAVIANLIHSLDAYLIRLVLEILDHSVMTIHDCFGIDILRVSLLMNIFNLCINKIFFGFNIKPKKKEYNYYSAFILL
jgi:hypothetical protein